MGCTSSKRIEDTVVDYRPSPATFSIFDVFSIEEPWLNAPVTDNEKKPSHVPDSILEKLKAIEESPRTHEVSKVLEDLKPKLSATMPLPPPVPQKMQETRPSVPRARPARRKSFSFHTLEELEARANSSKPTTQKPKFEFEKSKTQKTYSRNGVIAADVPRSLNENMFIVRDKFEREQERKSSGSVHEALKFERLPGNPPSLPTRHRGGTKKFI